MIVDQNDWRSISPTKQNGAGENESRKVAGSGVAMYAKDRGLYGGVDRGDGVANLDEDA